MGKSLAVLAVFGIVLACQSQQQKTGSLTAWKSDKAGCFGFRTYANTKALADSLQLDTLTKGRVNQLLGEPDAINGNGDNESYHYYFDSRCNKGQLIDSLDKCSLTIAFAISSKKAKVSLVCN